jgi:hypothetical protein
VLIALQVIVTPLLSRTQIPYLIDGQRLIVWSGIGAWRMKTRDA